ncbi:MAG: hypothetical protein Q4D98_07860 [Planctomycetia bacterium]|nr:hypothetical protein [Planctomycetia bacterium]
MTALFLTLVGTLSAEKPTSEASQALQAMNYAIAQLQRSGNLDVAFRFESHFFGKSILGHGIYKEEKSQYPDCSMRCEMTLQTPGGETHSFRFVLDHANHAFWSNVHPLTMDFYAAGGDSTIYHLNLDRIRRSPELRTQKGAPFRPPWYGQKSLENILLAIRNNFQFPEVWETSLPPIQSGQTEKIPVYYLRGEWKPEILEKILAGRKPYDGERRFVSPSGRWMPEEIPSEVRLFFDKKTMFPIQIEYFRQTDDGTRENMLTVTFYEVHYNVRFKQHQFGFVPPDFSSVKDITEDFLTPLSKP